MSRAERGAVPVELAAGAVLLVLPVAMLVASLPQWIEHRGAAGLAAREAARAVAVADDPRAMVPNAEALAREVLANHGITGSAVSEITVTAPLGPDGRVVRGGDVHARVRVIVPVTVTPLAGPIGGFRLLAEHREPVDAYRSLPP